MNVTYNDGRKELLTGLNPEQLAQQVERITSDPEFDHAEIQREKEATYIAAEYGDNRHGRRHYASDSRKSRKRGSNLTPPKKRSKKS